MLRNCVEGLIHSHHQKSELRLREYLDLCTGSMWSWWKVHSIGGRAVKVLHSETVGDMWRVLCMKDRAIFLSYHIAPAFIIKVAAADDKMKKSCSEFSLPLLQPPHPSIFALCYGPQKDENSWHTDSVEPACLCCDIKLVHHQRLRGLNGWTVGHLSWPCCFVFWGLILHILSLTLVITSVILLSCL